MKTVIVAIALVLSLAANAQLAFQPLSLHPANIGADSEFLVAIEDRWNNGCGGDISLEVTASRIEVVATSVSDQAGVVCTAEVLPFSDLLRPRASFAGDFADTVMVEYFFEHPDGVREIRSSIALTFNEEGNAPMNVETGAWISPGLESSGLFVDQQGPLFSANLADYFQGTGTWFFGAATVSGDTVIAELSRFGTIVCVTAPCPRAASLSTGTLLAVLKARNRMLVKYEGVLDSDVSSQGAYDYQRIALSSASRLSGVPDLAGQWIIGLASGSPGGLGSGFAEYQITLTNSDPVGGLETTTFAARNSNRVDDSLQPDFVIECQDAQPVDGDLACSSSELNIQDTPTNCFATFGYDAVGLRRVTGQARCGASIGDFVMVRL